jgi:hypothetical protein
MVVVRGCGEFTTPPAMRVWVFRPSQFLIVQKWTVAKRTGANKRGGLLASSGIRKCQKVCEKNVVIIYIFLVYPLLT